MQRRDSLKRKVILDCDPGIDDSLAIMLALCSPEIEVIAITIVAGNAPVKMGYQNAKKVLRHMNRLDIPVYIGEEKPLVKGPNAITETPFSERVSRKKSIAFFKGG